MPQAFDHFVVLRPNQLLDQIQVSPDIYQKLDEQFDGFRSHTLISAHQFTADWPTWEMHPEGDEMVVLISGRARFVLRKKTGDEPVELSEMGSYVIVPKGTWHTAHIDQLACMLFITPGEGTQNRTTPPDGA